MAAVKKSGISLSMIKELAETLVEIYEEMYGVKVQIEWLRLGFQSSHKVQDLYLNQVVKTLSSQYDFNKAENDESERLEVLGHNIWKAKEDAVAKKKDAKAVKSAKLATAETSLINRSSLSITAPSGSAKVGDMDGALGALSTNSK